MKFLFIIIFFIPTYFFGQSYVPNSNGQLVRHTNYILSYNEENEQAEWVYYIFKNEMLEKNVSRKDKYILDTNIITGSASKDDYDDSIYNKGHLIPSRDMLFSKEAMIESFLMSNISPQAKLFNNDVWLRLENKVRKWLDIEKELHIFVGDIFSDNLGFIGENRVAIPAYFYKIIFSRKNSKVVGFIIPNKESKSNLIDFVHSIDSIESLTNINFFHQLDEKIQFDLESTDNKGYWF